MSSSSRGLLRLPSSNVCRELVLEGILSGEGEELLTDVSGVDSRRRAGTNHS